MPEMHASKDQLSVETMGDYEGRMTQFGEYYVNFESIPAGFPPRRREGLQGTARRCLSVPALGIRLQGKVQAALHGWS